ncbi:MAG TPA: hypothetical protein VF680_17090 [Allosphingosinicella sp.]|jgi:DnaJ-class molecular chaperone
MDNKKECPQCLGVKEIMVPNEKRGFHYETCSLCKGEGEVHSEIHDDFIFAMNDELELNSDLDDEDYE